jgi:hypothetical protein
VVGDPESSGVVLELIELAFCRAFLFCRFLAAFDGPPSAAAAAVAASASSAANNFSIAVFISCAAGEPGCIIEISVVASSAFISATVTRGFARDIISFTFMRASCTSLSLLRCGGTFLSGGLGGGGWVC